MPQFLAQEAESANRVWAQLQKERHGAEVGHAFRAHQSRVLEAEDARVEAGGQKLARPAKHGTRMSLQQQAHSLEAPDHSGVSSVLRSMKPLTRQRTQKEVRHAQAEDIAEIETSGDLAHWAFGQMTNAFEVHAQDPRPVLEEMYEQLQ